MENNLIEQTEQVEKIDKGNVFYVYVYLDPRKQGAYSYGELKFDYEPFYIGKGHEERIDDHIREAILIENKNVTINKNNFPGVNLYKVNKILKIKEETGKDPITLKIKFNLEEKESFSLEKLCIKAIGRYDLGLGPLTNLTDGGDGPSGAIMSEEAKKKMSESRKGRIPWNKGVKNCFSEETMKVILENSIGENNPNYGKHLSDSNKKKIGLANSGKLEVKMIEKFGEIKGKKIAKEIGKKRGLTGKKTILKYSLDGKFIEECHGIQETADKMDVSNSCISDCISGVQQHGAGFIWRLKESENFPKEIEGYVYKEWRRTVPIIQYSLEGIFVKTWNSIVEASEALEITTGSISTYINETSNQRFAGGFIWIEKESEIVVGKIVVEKIIPKKYEKRDKVSGVLQYSLDGIFLKHWISIIDAAKSFIKEENSIKFESILQKKIIQIVDICRKENKTTMGFMWKYFTIEDFPKKIESFKIRNLQRRKVIQLTLGGVFKRIYESVSEAERCVGSSGISRACKKGLSSKGFLWKYAEDYKPEIL